MINISQKQLLSVTADIRDRFIKGAETYSKRCGLTPDDFYLYLTNYKNLFLNQIYGISALTKVDSKEYLILCSAIESIDVLAQNLINQFKQD